MTTPEPAKTVEQIVQNWLQSHPNEESYMHSLQDVSLDGHFNLQSLHSSIIEEVVKIVEGMKIVCEMGCDISKRSGRDHLDLPNHGPQEAGFNTAIDTLIRKLRDTPSQP